MIRRWLLVMLVVLILAYLTAPATGRGCRAVVHARYAAPVVVNKVAVVEAVKVIEAVPTFISQFVPVPVLSYGASYVPPAQGYAPPQQAPCPQQGNGGYGQGQGNDQLAAVLQRLDQRLANLETRAGISPPPRGGQQPMPGASNGNGGGAFLRKNCAACHEASVARRDGGGHVWLNGDTVAPLTAEQRLRMIARVKDGTMPPKSAIESGKVKAPTDEEFDAFLNEMTK